MILRINKYIPTHDIRFNKVYSYTETCILFNRFSDLDIYGGANE